MTQIDYDNDGDIDLLLGGGSYQPYHGSKANVILENDGHGRFSRREDLLPPDFDETTAVLVGDLDRDGWLDIISLSRGTPSRLYRNQGGVSFQEDPARFRFLGLALCGAILDLDRDGDLDLFIGAGGANAVFLNDGAGRLLDVSSLWLQHGTSTWTNACAACDINGDGFQDIIEGNESAENRILLNNGSSLVDASAQFGFGVGVRDTTLSLACADFNGDGKFDVAVGNARGASGIGPENRLYLSNSTGGLTLAPLSSFQVSQEWTQAIAAVDIDGDTDIDLVCANTTNGTGGLMSDLIWINSGSGTFTPISPFGPSPSWSFSVVVADFDGDLDLDVVTSGTLLLHLFLQSNALSFSRVSSETDIPDVLARAAVCFDINGDGHLDLLVGDDHGIRQYSGLGNGTFSFSGWVATGLGFVEDMIARDFNGDGGIDVFVGADGPDYVLEADLRGGFRLRPITGANASMGHDAGDVDGDGDIDLVFGNRQHHLWTSQNEVLLNDGLGNFTSLPGGLPVEDSDTAAVRLVDLDGDGDLDLFTANGGGNGLPRPDGLYLNNGAGVFSDASSHLPQRWTVGSAVDAGDADGDGDLDLLIGCGYYALPESNYLYVNDGAGRFLDSTPLELSTVQDVTREVRIADLDGDGDKDFFVANWGYWWQGEPNRVLLNGGPGPWRSLRDSCTLRSDPSYGLILADVDDDGDLDIVELAGSSIRFYFNQENQLSHSPLPRIGAPMSLDLRGRASEPWHLFASPSLGPPLPLSPLGTLWLSPQALFSFGSGSTDAQGQGGVSFFVPNWPFLVGIPSYWQAVVGFSPRLSGLERVVVGSY